MKRTNPPKLWLVVPLTLLLIGCGGERANDPPLASRANLTRALAQVTDQTILGAVKDFTNQTDSYANTADSFCASTNTATLASLQQQWRELFKSWYRLLVYNFGPLQDLPDGGLSAVYAFIDAYRVRGTNYQDSVTADLQTQVNATNNLNSAFFRNRTIQFTGLLPLEVLSFSTLFQSQSKNAEAIVSEYNAQPRKCLLLKGLATELKRHGHYVLQKWQTPASGLSFRDRFVNAKLENGTEPVTQLLTSAQEYLDYLKKRNVVTSVAKLSDTAWLALGEAIDEVSELLEGGDKTTISLFQIMQSGGFQTAVEKVRANIRDAKANISAKNADLLAITLGKLDGNFKREIPQSLNVELGINFTDGD